MTVSKQQILASVAIVEQQAPLFLSDLPVSDDVVRDLFASSLAALTESTGYRRATTQSRELALLAILTHALLETACLRHQLVHGELAAATETGRLMAKAAAH